jgi:hypothetical protein
MTANACGSKRAYSHPDAAMPQRMARASAAKEMATALPISVGFRVR